MQQSGEDFTLIDVREREEHEKGSIPGATGMSRGVLRGEHRSGHDGQEPQHRVVLRRRRSLGAGGFEPEEDGVPQREVAGRRISGLARVGNPVTSIPL